MVKVQVVGIISFPRTHATYHFPYIFIFNGMNGIDLYRMQVGIEAYQVDHNEQIIRFYVHRNKMECP